jgi:putative acetyltransferase
MQIETDDLSRPAVQALLEEHLRNMHELSPPESVHALDLAKLRHPDITFWTAWRDGDLLGCGALKAMGDGQGEVKSMRTPQARRGQGAAKAILTHVVDVARSRAYRTLWLETGAPAAFLPARKLYETFGFTYCGPFSGYEEDPNSVFMTLRL